MKTKVAVFSAAVLIFASMSGCGTKTQDDEGAMSLEKALEDTTMMNTEANQVQKPQSMEAVVASESNLPVDPIQPVATQVSVPFENVSTQKIQEALKNANFYSGKIDGVLGPKSKQAIKDFQSNNNLTPDGKVGPKTWQKLGPYLNAAPVTTGAEPAQPVSN